jgi:hypothetical protein
VSEAAVLVIRLGDTTWGVPSGTVRAVRRSAGGIQVELPGGSLAADEVVGVTTALEVSPPGRVLGLLWPEPCAGLAVWSSRPLVVIDAEHPPAVLRIEEGESSDAQHTV